MVSVASGGTAERIAARIRFSIVRAGSDVRSMYSSTAAGPVSRARAVEPPARVVLLLTVHHSTGRVAPTRPLHELSAPLLKSTPVGNRPAPSPSTRSPVRWLADGGRTGLKEPS